MKIPLEKRLRKQSHRDLGYLQDEALEILYSISPDFILHGGTAIWRCFGGGRFSEDIDLYAPKLPVDFGEKFKGMLVSRGLQMQKFKTTENTVFCKIKGNGEEMRIEINISKKPPEYSPIPYGKMDGSSMIAICLTADSLIVEKASAYISRKLIRDVYDVYFLSNIVEKPETGKELAALLRKFPEPLDESTLKTLIYSGTVPSFPQMMEILRRKFP
ncbi:MAG: nucleotidyl transferase AbiEii/AbiGii toxin family protein [Candidatus Micrarchaeota archaeon]